MEKYHAQYNNYVKELILWKIEKKMGLNPQLERSESSDKIYDKRNKSS